MDPALVDQTRLAQLEDIARDPSFLSELVNGFMNDVAGIIARTRDAVASGDAGPIPDLMHSLKGAAVGVGAARLASLAADFDRTAERLSVHDMTSRLREVERCFDATSAQFKQYLLAHGQADLHVNR